MKINSKQRYIKSGIIYITLCLSIILYSIGQETINTFYLDFSIKLSNLADYYCIQMIAGPKVFFSHTLFFVLCWLSSILILGVTFFLFLYIAFATVSITLFPGYLLIIFLKEKHTPTELNTVNPGFESIQNNDIK